MKYLEKLLSISTNSFSQNPPALSHPFLQSSPTRAKELERLLTIKNGCFAFESALRIFPTEITEYSTDVYKWNSESLWRNKYQELTAGLFFFAENGCGDQFCFKEEIVYIFESETGNISKIADSVDSWSKKILNEYNYHTYFQLIHEWQKKNGKIPHDKRLIPKTPFIMGGEYSVDNLSMISSVEGMRLKGTIAKQIEDLPDGSKVKIVYT